MESVRTPDERFEDLEGYSFSPHYVELEGFDGMRTHYLDEGSKDAEYVYLCLHGEPTWAYLYRKMIPVFVEAGGRVIAPDFFGFGRSDKPVDDAAYTFGFHRRMLLSFIEQVVPGPFTLVCQDWGGLLGLTLPVDIPDRISRLLVMNTALAVGVNPGKGFLEWRDYVANNPEFDVGRLMQRAAPDLTDGERAAYLAPFPDAKHMAGARTFPALVPIEPDMEGAEISRRAATWWASEWSGPTFMAVGVQDPVLGPPVMKMLAGTINGCPEPMMLEHAGHFVQEAGDEVARAALAAFSE